MRSIRKPLVNIGACLGAALGLFLLTGQALGPIGAFVGVSIGTSGATVPLLNGVNTWSGTQTHTAPTVVAAAGSGIGLISTAPVNAAASTLAPRLFSNTCGLTNTGGTSTANAAATNAWVAEIYVPYNVSTTGAAVYQVATNNGTDTLYLADNAGNQVLHTAAVTSAGASAYQLIPWTASPSVIQGPATYFLVATNSGTTNTFGTIPGPSTCAVIKITGATYGVFPTLANPPASTFTATNVGPIMSLY